MQDSLCGWIHRGIPVESPCAGIANPGAMECFYGHVCLCRFLSRLPITPILSQDVTSPRFICWMARGFRDSWGMGAERLRPGTGMDLRGGQRKICDHASPPIDGDRSEWHLDRAGKGQRGTRSPRLLQAPWPRPSPPGLTTTGPHRMVCTDLGRPGRGDRGLAPHPSQRHRRQDVGHSREGWSP
jgi:hypothetical protein